MSDNEMNMTRVMLATAFLIASLGGCYMKPLRTNNPLNSPEGVRLRLIGQDCQDHAGSDGDPVSRDLFVKLELANPTKEVLRFSPDSVILTVERSMIGAMRVREDYQIAPGETRSFELRFLHHSICDHDFALAFDNALSLGSRPVTLTALHFTPY